MKDDIECKQLIEQEKAKLNAYLLKLRQQQKLQVSKAVLASKAIKKFQETVNEINMGFKKGGEEWRK